MTLVMAEACEDLFEDINNVKPWTGGASFDASGRTGSRWVAGTSVSNRPIYTVPTADRSDRMTCGFAVRTAATPNSNTGRFVQFRSSTGDGSVALETAVVTGTNTHKVRAIRVRDGVVLGETADAVIGGDVWHYVELKVLVHGSAGTVELRTNEVTRLNLTGLDTLPAAGGSQIAQLAFTPSLSTVAIDDIYLVNDAGATNNDFLGDVTVHRLFPTAAGDSAQFLPEPITAANWETVDDFSTTDYNEAVLAGLTDLYNFANLPGSVSGRQVFGLLSWGLLHSISLPRGGALLSKLSGTEAESATIALTGTAAGYLHRQETRPGGGAWTTGDVNTAQHGVRVKS